MEIKFNKLQIDLNVGAPNGSAWDSNGYILMDSVVTPKTITLRTPQKDGQMSLNRVISLSKNGVSGDYISTNNAVGSSIKLTPDDVDPKKLNFSIQLRHGLDGTLNALLCDNELVTKFVRFGYNNANNKGKPVDLPFEVTVNGSKASIVLPTLYTSTKNVIGKIVLKA